MLKNNLNLNKQQEITFIKRVVLLAAIFNLFSLAWFGLTHYNLLSIIFFISIIFISLTFLVSFEDVTNIFLFFSMLVFTGFFNFYLRFRFVEEAINWNEDFGDKKKIDKNSMLAYTLSKPYKPSLVLLAVTMFGICSQILNDKCYIPLQIAFAAAFFASIFCMYKIFQNSVKHTLKSLKFLFFMLVVTMVSICAQILMYKCLPSLQLSFATIFFAFIYCYYQINKETNSKTIKKNDMLKYDPISARWCLIILILASFDMVVMGLKILSTSCLPYYRINFGIAYITLFICFSALFIFAEQKKYYSQIQNESPKSDIVAKVKENPVLVEQHPFHILAASALPFFTSLFTFDMLFFTVKYFHYGLNKYVSFHLIFSISGLIITLTIWFLSIIKESNEGHHTKKVRWNLLHGMMLFIVSEVMLFFSIFWAFFHSSLSPSVAIYCMWPPLGIETINPWLLPFLNTVVLLSSGVSLTYAHSCLVAGEYKLTSRGLLITLGYGIFFSIVQLFEYINAPFSINDGIYGSVFFLSTGFHGLHVIIGSIMLLVNLIRNGIRNLLPSQHVGFIAAAWYWHFVDVVWLFLFLTIYWWGS